MIHRTISNIAILKAYDIISILRATGRGVISVTFQRWSMYWMDSSDVRSASNCPEKGLMLNIISWPLWTCRQLSCAFIKPILCRVIVAKLRQMKLAMWLPSTGWTVRHLLWVAKLSCSQCAVTPIYKQLLDAIHISTVMACVEACLSEVLSALLTDTCKRRQWRSNVVDGICMPRMQTLFSTPCSNGVKYRRRHSNAVTCECMQRHQRTSH